MRTRTNYDLQFEVEYAGRVCGLHETVWRRIGVLLTVVSVLGATAAVKGYVDANTDLATISGLVLAVLAVINLVLTPSARAQAYKQDGKRYAAFAAFTAGLDPYDYDNDLDKKLQELRAGDEPDIRALTYLAYRDAMKRFGHEDKEPLGFMPRFFSVLA